MIRPSYSNRSQAFIPVFHQTLSNSPQQGIEAFFEPMTPGSTWRSSPAPNTAPSRGPTKKKYLIQMSGPPGTGKSTLAKKIAFEMRQAGLGAVVINHDLLKTFFLLKVSGMSDETDPAPANAPAFPHTPVAPSSTTSTMMDNPTDGGIEPQPQGHVDEPKTQPQEKKISFTDAAKLTYKLDWVLAMDMFDQGQDAVIVDSVCNYREAVENGLDMAKKWNSCPDPAACVAVRTKTRDGKCCAWECDLEMRYVYVECRFGSDTQGQGSDDDEEEEDGLIKDLDMLDQRLKERAGKRQALSSQRRGVYLGPVGDSEKPGSLPLRGEGIRDLFRKWMNPARPTAEDGATIVVVDSKKKSSDECAGIVMRELGLADLEDSSKKRRR